MFYIFSGRQVKNVAVPNNFYEKYQVRISKAQTLIKMNRFLMIKSKVFKKYGIENEWLHDLEDHILEDLINELLRYYKK